MKHIVYLSLLATAFAQGASTSGNDGKSSIIPFVPRLSQEAERAYKLEMLAGLSKCTNEMVEIQIDLGPDIEPSIITAKQRMRSTFCGRLLNNLALWGFGDDAHAYVKSSAQGYINTALRAEPVKEALSKAEGCQAEITERVQAWTDFRAVLCQAIAKAAQPNARWIRLAMLPKDTIAACTQAQGPIQAFFYCEQKYETCAFIAAQLATAYGLELQLQKAPDVFKYTHKGYLTFQPEAPMSADSSGTESPSSSSSSESDTSYEASSEHSSDDDQEVQED